MLKRIGFILAMLASAGIMAQTVAHWKFKDGTGSARVIDSTQNGINGDIVNPGNCEWAREDDRGFFLAFSPKGSVQIPHNYKLDFAKGFIAEIHFSCKTESIDGSAALLAKGQGQNQGYSVMVRENGNLLVSLKGMAPECSSFDTKIQNNVDYRLLVALGGGELKVFLDGKMVGKYPVAGSLEPNNLPLSIGAINGEGYPFSGNIYEIKLSGFDKPSFPKNDVVKAPEIPEFTSAPIHDPKGTVIINDFSKFSSCAPSDNQGNGESWRIRDNVGFMGEQTTTVLHAPECIPPRLELNPGLTGIYDVYAGVRAANIPMSVQIKTSAQKDYYTVNTDVVGEKHGNMELLLGRDIPMDGNLIQIAGTGKICYLGYIKFIPVANRRAKENPQDPSGSVVIRPACTEEELEAESEKAIAQKIKEGYFIERSYIEKRGAPKLSAESVKRGYIIFERNYLDLVFPVTVPESDPGKIALRVAATPGEYEPCSFAVRGLQDINGLTLRQSLGFEDTKIDVTLAVVGAMPKRTTNYTGSSEFMVGPQYLEPVAAFNLKKGETKQFWITFHVADGVKPGVYHAELELAAKGGVEKIPVAFRVYPFKLDLIEGIDLGFWVNSQLYHNVDGANAIDVDMKHMADYGNNSMAVDLVAPMLMISGKTLDTVAIDFGKSRITAIVAAFNRYRMNGYLHLLSQEIFDYSMIFPKEQRHQVYIKIITQLEDYAKKNNWPKRAYHSFDEVLSSPQNLPLFIEETRLQKELGLTVGDDHIWYKTSRPFQKEVTEASQYIDIFVNRYNNRCLFYVDTWETMLAKAAENGKKLYTYNTTNCITSAQPAAMRCLGGWFFRTIGKGCSGQLFWVYKCINGNPYTDLDGADWLCLYPSVGKRKGGPAIDWEAHREGIDDLRYIITLENVISMARKENRVEAADAAQKTLDSITQSFDWDGFRKKSIFWDSKWTEEWAQAGKRYAAGQYNLPNGWRLDDYDLARQRIAEEIIKLRREP